tara:strand:- start:5813 stop:7075 length:1263 start_codon:yes stop_codon:yes gene_type:complete
MGRIDKKQKARRLKQALIDIDNNKVVNRRDDLVENNKGYRMFVIGAGFSVPAGLPMASELFSEVRSRIEMNYGIETRFHRSLAEYIDYRKKCDGVDLAPEDVDLEAFMSYLDIEHFLGLEGSDTFSEHGNEAQLFVKRYIGQVIHERTPKQDELPAEYYEFAEQLSVHDIVITLNYDVILERALEHIGKPYRLFPNRYSQIYEHSSTVDSSIEEVTILKLHGSLDWFSDKLFQYGVRSFAKQGVKGAPNDPIFNNNNRYGHYPLVDGPRRGDDPLNNIYRLKNIDAFYSFGDPPSVPMILSPSHMKIVYANPFLDFWYGIGQSGGYNLGLNIIGFSLPEHDDYIRISLFKMVENYQSVCWDDRLLDSLKDNVKVVDYRTCEAGKADLRSRYSFIDEEKSEFYTDGFSSKAVEFLFKNSRT